LAKLNQLMPTISTITSLVTAWFVVDSRVNDPRVFTGLMRRYSSLFFQYQ